MESLQEQFRRIDFDLKYGMEKAISNAKNGGYPYAKLNDNGSISFFNSGLDEKDFDENLTTFENEVVERIFSETAKKKGFKIIDGKERIVEKIYYDDSKTTEYKINLSPRNLDAILKTISIAYFYRGDNSILNLEHIAIPDDVDQYIRLSPVFLIGDKYLMRSAGCQVIEMPSVQLLKVLQKYLKDIGELDERFHWVPKVLSKDFSIDRGEILSTINILLGENDLLLDQKGIRAQDDAESYIKIPQGESIVIAGMNDANKDFYLKYGNLEEDELNQCKSLEVRSDKFIECVIKTLERQIKYYQDRIKENNAQKEQFEREKSGKSIDDKRMCRINVEIYYLDKYNSEYPIKCEKLQSIIGKLEEVSKKIKDNNRERETISPESNMEMNKFVENFTRLK